MLGVVIFKGCSALVAALFQAQNREAGNIHVCSAEKVNPGEMPRTIWEWQDPDDHKGRDLRSPAT